MNSIKLTGFIVCNDIKNKIKKEKYNYINYMITHGLRYNSIQLMSIIANSAIDLFNTEKEETINIDENFQATKNDIVEINKHINLFELNMSKAEIPQEIVKYMIDISKETLLILKERYNLLNENNKIT